MLYFVFRFCLIYNHIVNVISKTYLSNVYPLKPNFYIVKLAFTGRGIPIFLIFDPNHTLLVLVRTTSARRFKRVPTIYVLSKKKKKKKAKIEILEIFLQLKTFCILHGHVFVIRN